jgi:glycine betaine/proline transport system permease protein
VVVILLLVGVQLAFSRTSGFPTGWRLGIENTIDQIPGWLRSNRRTHPMFVYFLQPLSAGINGGLELVESVLKAIPWFVFCAIAAFILLRAGRVWAALLAIVGVLYFGVVGLWEEGLETLALMGVAVAIALLIGIPLGIWAAFNRRVERALRPILDSMQVLPAFVYLIPVVLLFGIARVPATIATVIFALAPAVRLTTLGIKQVPQAVLEAAEMMGTTRRQKLFKVQIPIAMPTILAAVNQTIMLALGIVIIASLIGAGGLGTQVLNSLQRFQVGQAFEAGIAVVVMAILLDRLSRTFVERPEPGQIPWYRSRRVLWIGLGIIVLLALAGLVAGVREFPDQWRVSFARPIDSAVDWAQNNLYLIGNTGLGTKALNEFLNVSILNPLRDLLTFLAWPVLILFTGFICWKAGGGLLAVFAMISLFVIGVLGMWELALDTLTQVLVAVVLALAIAIPVGVWSARSNRVRTLLTPLLDTLQTIPSFVFLVPVIMLFSAGRVPGIIASVLYAIPPGIRLTDLGLRSVPAETLEAAECFGSTPRQMLWKVQVPLAMPTIMAGVNQVVMLALSMVVVGGLVGGGGLGFESVRALTRGETALGVKAGLAIVLMAMILDRLTQAWAARMQPTPAAA